MIEAKIGTILENACRLAGRDPETVGIPDGWKILAGMALAAGLDTLAAEKFPALERVEFRRYRPPWAGGIAYEKGQEVWHGGAYWRMDDPLAGGEPGVADGWRRLEMGEVAAFIAFNQPWEQVVMQSFGVDTTRFAYKADPRYNPDATPIRECRLCELGVLIPAPAPEGVWVKFVPEYPPISFEEWSDVAAHLPGETVYRPETHDVWQCVGKATVGVAPEDDEAGAWRPLRVRGEFAAYLTRLVASDLLTEDQGKFQTKAAADAELERLIERFHEGSGETRVRTGRFRR
ncbi:MAG: hypothetical protein IJ829_05800 [Kiritimatiellae bacterium]|nr:hypothetical protein [Kiritimatiellia bacterium]